jgi:hypothetical protein
MMGLRTFLNILDISYLALTPYLSVSVIKLLIAAHIPTILIWWVGSLVVIACLSTFKDFLNRFNDWRTTITATTISANTITATNITAGE